MASSNNVSSPKEEAITEKVSINVDVEPTAPIEAYDGVSADNDAENIDDAGTGAAQTGNVDSMLHPLRDSEPNSAASSAAASRRSTVADIEGSEDSEGEGLHYHVDDYGRRKSRNLREAVAHLKEEAIRRLGFD